MSARAGFLAAAIAVAIGVGGGLLVGRANPVRRTGSGGAGRDEPGHGGRQGRAEDPVLPQSDGAARHLAGAEEGSDGHGLHRRLRRRGTRSGSSQIKISVDKVQKLGVRTEPAAMRSLDKVIRAVGRVEVDERRVFAIAPKFEGWVERLFVNATGQPVSKGQPLFEVYSPELVSAQREYAIAIEAVKALKDAGDDPQAGMKRLADSSLARLKNWDISDEQVRALTQSGEARRTLTFRSPVSGIVMEKKAVQGMRFMPGDSLYQIADLSSVWVMADVYEQDIGLVRTGSKAKVSIGAYPDQKFEGTITYVYPTLKPETRTVSGAAGNRQSPPVAEAGDVRGGRVARRRQGESADRAEFGRHRQRHAPHRAGSARGRPLRAARGEAGSPHATTTSR